MYNICFKIWVVVVCSDLQYQKLYISAIDVHSTAENWVSHTSQERIQEFKLVSRESYYEAGGGP
jgi:hypothetical protein